MARKEKSDEQLAEMLPRGRKPSSAAVLVEDAPLDAGVLLAQQNQVARLDEEQEARVRAVATQLGYQLPADCTSPDLIQRDIAANMRRSVEACLEVGRGLQVLKVACGHGNFIERLDSLGVDRKVAVKFMTSAAKFASLGNNSALTKAIGSQSKLFEMLVLDDEQIEELELTGQSGELSLDDVATMSVKELRKALREAREEKDDVGRVLASKSAELNQAKQDLEKAKRRIQTMSPDDVTKEMRQAVVGIAFEAEADITGKLREAFNALDEHAAQTGTDHRAFQAQLVAHLEQLLRTLRDEFQLPDTGGEDFSWMTPEEQEA
jgi:hypothetical protein